MAGIYVHIPFCKSRCIYCGFYSTTHIDMQGRYVDALIRELEIRKDFINEPVRTIYLGGGTPSQLSDANLERLCHALNAFAKAKNGADNCVEEFTMECNPDDVTREFAARIVALGVNRVSMGVQSFSDSRLKFLHRRHNTDNVKFAVRILREAGVKNISVDLMFGFPNETMEDLEYDISHLIRLDVDHVSAYSLMYEEDTQLYAMLEKGLVNEIDEDTSRAMYERICYRLSAADYEQYEISNFARQGFESKHNSSYWDFTQYLGIGAAAHSFNGAVRQWNVSDLYSYMDSILNENPQDAIEKVEANTEEIHYNDIITTALRTRKGIDFSAGSKYFQLPGKYREYLLANAQKHIDNGLLCREGDSIRLAQKGLYVSDAIMSDLVMA